MRGRIAQYRDQWKYRNYRKPRERDYGDVMTSVMIALAALLTVAVLIVMLRGSL